MSCNSFIDIELFNSQFNIQNNPKIHSRFDTDLSYKQSVDILITGSQLASQNKKLDIYINSSTLSVNTTEALVVGDLDLPVYFNTINSLPNSAYLWSDFNFNIDFNKTIQYTIGNILEIPLSDNQSIINNSIKVGDTYRLNNFFVGTSSVFDFSGQYSVNSISGTSSYIYLNADSNPDLVGYFSSLTLPFYIHGTSSTLLSNNPYFSLNKGKKIKLTRVKTSGSLSEKYQIDIQDIK